MLKLDSPVQAWVRPAQFVSENIHLSELLQLMQRSGQPMAIVVDEFGGTAGLVTLQDLAAEIMGDTHEGEDLEEPDVEVIDDQNFRVQAQTDLEEVNELLDLNLPLSEDYQTLGGFLIYQMQKIPAVGEKLQYETYEMTVEAAEGPRLQKILIHRLESSLSSDEADLLAETILSETGDLIDTLTDRGTDLPDPPRPAQKQI
jgi:CBS domain containing-hemolysin-like protein